MSLYKENNKIVTEDNIKEHKSYSNFNILLYYFLKKLYNYEPGIVRLIGTFHDYNYQYLTLSSYLIEKPLKLGRCMGNYYINNDDIYNCVCSNCDPDGFNLLKPYRISHRL
jgi:hypothetical protein